MAGCQLSRATCFLLGVSRVFGIAPLSFSPAHCGCTASVSPKWTVYGFVSLMLSGGISVTIVVSQVILTEQSWLKVSSILRLLNYSIAVYIACVATLTASTRMKRFVLNTRKLEQINMKVHHEWPVGSWKAWAPVPYTILGVALITVILLWHGHSLEDQTIKSTWSLIIYIWFLCLLTLLKYHLSFMMMAIYTTLKAVNQSLTAYLTTVKDPVTCPEVVYEYGVLYSSACDVIFDVNAEEGALYFAVYTQYFLSTTFTIYLVATAAREGQVTVVVLQMLWMLHNLSRIIINIEACHRVKTEIEKAKVIVCGAGCADADGRAARRADVLQVLALVRNVFSPLGVFSLTRSFIVTTFSFITTFVVIFLQFKLFDE